MEGCLYFTRHNISNLNDIIYRSWKVVSPLFYNNWKIETSIFLFHTFTKTKTLWTQPRVSAQDSIMIPQNTPQSDIVGFTDHEGNYKLIKPFLLIFKYYINKARENRRLDLKVLKKPLIKKNILKKHKITTEKKKD